MLDSLLGTLDPSSGRRADNGLMVHVDGARYRVRDINSFRYVLCSYQDLILNTLWAAAGLHGMLISTIGHDPAAVFIPEFAKWVYEDPEWNEEYHLDGRGDPLSPTELLSLSSVGEGGRLQPRKMAGPSWDPDVYVAGDSYIAEGHSEGMVIMGSQLNNRLVGIVGAYSWPMRYVQIDVPRLAAESPFNDPTRYAVVDSAVAFPSLGVLVAGIESQDSVLVVHLGSTVPSTQQFQRRVDGGVWASVSATDVLPVGQCRIEYRGVDAAGTISAAAVLDLWVPRGRHFLESAIPGSVRAQASYCS
jgi:hypothetical protein